MSLDRKEEKKKSNNNDTLKKFAPSLINNVLYSLTINPQDQFTESKSRYIDWYSSVVTFFKKHNICDFCELDVITEISYPLKNGVDKRKPHDIKSRLHLHGTILFIDVVKWFIYIQPFLAAFCIYEIDTIHDSETWNSYIHKDKNQWVIGRDWEAHSPTNYNIMLEPFTSYHLTNEIILNQRIKRKKNHPDNIDNPIVQKHPLLTDENQSQFYCEASTTSDPNIHGPTQRSEDECDSKSTWSFSPTHINGVPIAKHRVGWEY